MTFGLNEEVLNTNLTDFYTYGQILHLFHEHCPEFKNFVDGGARVKEVTFVDINNGKGFTSNIYSTVVKFENTDDQFKVAIKMPTTQKLLENFVGDGDQEVVNLAHKTECTFYELFRDINDGFAPNCYYTDAGNSRRPGLIILDDLSGRCVTFGIFKTCTIGQFWNVARKVAHFQAIAASHQKDSFPCFNDFLVKAFHEKVYEPLIGQLVEYDQKFKPAVDRLSKIFSQRFTEHAIFGKAKELDCLVAIHADLWTNNVLFELNEDGSVSDNPLHFVDWQVAQTGNPFYDIVRFLAISIDAEIRREIEIDVVDRFYAMLIDEYDKQSGGKMKPKFSLEQANELYDLTFLDQTGILMILVPFYKSVYKNESPSILEAKLAKLALRTWLCVEDALKVGR
ncbi:hypothetical protein M3Y97_01095000 [Aphelenchoides bicaudatus]|nr:hypothetical protein M3Y97_01095000 [Aphelenchoides bicaudatus]